LPKLRGLKFSMGEKLEAAVVVAAAAEDGGAAGSSEAASLASGPSGCMVAEVLVVKDIAMS
jgi:hypothetical protein